MTTPRDQYRTLGLDGRVEVLMAVKPALRASVFKHLSFHGFLHLGNPQKPAKTGKLGNLATYVLFHRNSQKDELWKPKKPTETC